MSTAADRPATAPSSRKIDPDTIPTGVEHDAILWIAIASAGGMGLAEATGWAPGWVGAIVVAPLALLVAVAVLAARYD
jgi:hypothetical protein